MALDYLNKKLNSNKCFTIALFQYYRIYSELEIVRKTTNILQYCRKSKISVITEKYWNTANVFDYRNIF